MAKYILSAGAMTGMIGSLRQGARRTLGLAILVFAIVTARSQAAPAGSIFDSDFYPEESVLGHDGRFYGPLMEATGVPHCFGGSVYAIDPAGKLKYVHRFPQSTNSHPIFRSGSGPVGPLSPGQDGSIYGATREGGVFGYGTLFKIGRNGGFSVLHHLEHPVSYKYGVVAAQNGDIFALSDSYPTYEVVRISKDGAARYYTITAEFANGIIETADHRIVVSSEDPYRQMTYSLLQLNDQTGEFEAFAHLDSLVSRMVPLPDGSLLVVEEDKIVQVDASGNVSLIHEFSIPFEGTGPDFLVVAKDGSYLGTTFSGGLVNAGTIFRIVPGTNEFSLVDFLPSQDGVALGDVWLKRFGALREAAVSGNHLPDAMDIFLPSTSLHATSGGLPSTTISIVPHDPDRDHDALSVVSIGSAQHGAAGLDFVTQKVTYTADAMEVQNDDFTYTIADGRGGTSVGHVIIRTNPHGRYKGEVDSVPNTTTGDPGTNVGSLSVQVNGSRMLAARLELLGKTYRFVGHFNEVNRCGALLLSNPRTGETVGAQLWLQPNGSGWTVQASVQKDNLPYEATCTVGGPPQ